MADTQYTFSYHDYYSGDVWYGTSYADSYQVYTGQTWNTNYGYYSVDSTYYAGYDAWADGYTYVSTYYDWQTNSYYTPSNYASGYPSGYNGAGSEYDYIWKGYYDDFGYGGFYLA